MKKLAVAVPRTDSEEALEMSVHALVEAGWITAEDDLRRAADAFDRAADILRVHWGSLQHQTRQGLLESCLDAAESFRRVARLEVVQSRAEVDEALAERMACL